MHTYIHTCTHTCTHGGCGCTGGEERLRASVIPTTDLLLRFQNGPISSGFPRKIVCFHVASASITFGTKSKMGVSGIYLPRPSPL